MYFICLMRLQKYLEVGVRNEVTTSGGEMR